MFELCGESNPWQRLLRLNEDWLRRESLPDRERRLKTAMARARGPSGNWRTLLLLTDGLLVLRRSARPQAGEVLE